MKKTFVIIVFEILILTKFARSDACKPSNIQCTAWNQYKICLEFNNKQFLVGDPITCPPDTICDDEGFFPCLEGTTTTTTLAPTTIPPPACFGASKHPSSRCEQYYECIPVAFWWEPRLITCPLGEAFDSQISDCRPADSNCQFITVTTVSTTAGPVTIPPPACSWASKHPATDCRDYYECVWFALWWQPELKTCPEGEAFDKDVGECSPNEDLICG